MLARRFAQGLRDPFGTRATAVDLGDYDYADLSQLQRVSICAFLLSTYGDGEPPDNATGFCEALQRLQANDARLDSVQYFMFGVGNSNYRQFNQVAQSVEAQLQALYAKRLAPIGRGDDARDGTKLAFQSWRQGCETALKDILQLQEQTRLYRPSFIVKDTPPRLRVCWTRLGLQTICAGKVRLPSKLCRFLAPTSFGRTMNGWYTPRLRLDRVSSGQIQNGRPYCAVA